MWYSEKAPFLFKRPVSAGQFVIDKAFHEVMAGIDNRTTVLLGHTRWRTRGDEWINRNNHPVRAGDVIGTHNGTIYNADYLFRRFKLPRFAQVDSATDCGLRISDCGFHRAITFSIRSLQSSIHNRNVPAFLDAVLAEERGWRELPVPAMSLIVFRHEVLMEFSRESLEFIAQAKRGNAP